MNPPAATPRQAAPTSPALAERLERGALLTFAPCPFPLPAADDRTLLTEQRLEYPGTRHISYDARRERVRGFAHQSAAQAQRLRDVLARSAAEATRWLSALLPWPAAACALDYVAFHPEEEATRKLRLLDRNDLLHIDAAPTQPTRGRRMLRLFVNLHPTDPRVWQTSLLFAELVQRYGPEVGLPALSAGTWWQPLRHGLLRLLQPARTSSAPYDDFLQRLHDYLKRHESFQERAPRKCWHFAPGTAWLVFTDGVSHAELRGRFVLEFAFFIAEQYLVCPDLSPHAQFLRACDPSSTSKAA